MKQKVEVEINSSTVLIRNIGKDKAEIVNLEGRYILPFNNKKILDTTCKIFGSSLNGRIESSKEWLGCDYKLPILIDEIRNLVFFPTRSIDSKENIWCSFNIIDDYRKHPEGIELLLIDGQTMVIKESFNIFENQYIRAYKLHKRIEKMKATIY